MRKLSHSNGCWNIQGRGNSINKVTEAGNITVYVGKYKLFCVWGTLKFKIKKFGKVILERQVLALFMVRLCITLWKGSQYSFYLNLVCLTAKTVLLINFLLAKERGPLKYYPSEASRRKAHCLCIFFSISTSKFGFLKKKLFTIFLINKINILKSMLPVIFLICLW